MVQIDVTWAIVAEASCSVAGMKVCRVVLTFRLDIIPLHDFAIIWSLVPGDL
jgi:hypothetical protein